MKTEKNASGRKTNRKSAVVKNGDSVPTSETGTVETATATTAATEVAPVVKAVAVAPVVPIAPVSGEVANGTGTATGKPEVEKESGYTGTLPTHEGKPVAIAREAWSFYLNPRAYGVEAGRIRNYLMIQDALRLAEALGHPLTIEDLKVLVRPDGVLSKCSATGVEFQPMSWTLVTSRTLEKIRDGMTLQELDDDDDLVVVGHFFSRKGVMLCYSGTPYRWHKDYERDQIAWQAPVTQAFKANGDRWPSTFETASQLRVSHTDRQKELVSVGEVIQSQIGSWKPSGRRTSRA